MSVKTIAIIGAGNGGQTFASYLSMKGLKVRIFDVFQKTVDILDEKGGVEIEGNADLTGFGRIEFATTDMGRALEGADMAWIILPSIYHKDMAAKMAPYLKDGFPVFLNPMGPMGAMEFVNVLRENGCEADVKIAAASTLVFACRIEEAGKVYVNGMKEMVDVAAYPGRDNALFEELLSPIIPQYTFVKNILKISFDNIGFELHPGPTLLDAGLIESGKPFEYYRDFGPSQVRLVEAIDAERMKLVEKYQVDTVTTDELFREMYACEGDLLTMINTVEVYKGVKGPSSMNVRYIFEDIPYSLRAIQTLARIAHVETPAVDTVLNLAYILYGDHLDEGRTLKNLGLSEDTTVEDVLAMCN